MGEKDRMINEITPEGSVAPVYLDAATPAPAEGAMDAWAPGPEEEAKRAEFAAVRDKVAEALSLTPAEAVSLFGSNGDPIP